VTLLRSDEGSRRSGTTRGLAARLESSDASKRGDGSTAGLTGLLDHLVMY